MNESMDELNRYQKSIIESLEQENYKYIEINKELDFQSLLSKADHYCHKVVDIKRQMKTLSERSEQMKRRALRLQSIKSNEQEVIETQKYNELEKEKRLQPKVANK